VVKKIPPRNGLKKRSIMASENPSAYGTAQHSTAQHSGNTALSTASRHRHGGSEGTCAGLAATGNIESIVLLLLPLPLLLLQLLPVPLPVAHPEALQDSGLRLGEDGLQRS
jgi:hypothetical protein